MPPAPVLGLITQKVYSRSKIEQQVVRDILIIELMLRLKCLHKYIKILVEHNNKWLKNENGQNNDITVSIKFEVISYLVYYCYFLPSRIFSDAFYRLHDDDEKKVLIWVMRVPLENVQSSKTGILQGGCFMLTRPAN